ncbi:hypothetical protein Mterra_02114 [Calidithermus terrae]|uniref:Uncharacterized protein n=1 Tax=Calidithermus terrae TaxID=1408545 RepID=A0A399EHC6_9DEIN|nr:hypothetical protein [Calidithermus terrae]RIH84007.1 hypothetical protein Mterra_02114 [Calidithermus terrae]
MQKPNQNDTRLIQMLERILALNDQVLLLVHDRPDLLSRFVDQRIGVLRVLDALQSGTPAPPEALPAFGRVARQLEEILLRSHQIQAAPRMDA